MSLVKKNQHIPWDGRETKVTVTCTNFFGQQVERNAGLVVLETRHGNFAVAPRVFVRYGYVVVYYSAHSRVLGHNKRVRPA